MTVEHIWVEFIMALGEWMFSKERWIEKKSLWKMLEKNASYLEESGLERPVAVLLLEGSIQKLGAVNSAMEQVTLAAMTRYLTSEDKIKEL